MDNETPKHVPFNTAPMTREEREKELTASGSGTAAIPSKKKDKGEKGKKDATPE